MIKYFLITLILSSSAWAQKHITCADGVCTSDFTPKEQFEKIYHTGIDVGEDNEDDILVETGGNQSPRAARIYVDNKSGHNKNATIDLSSKSDFFDAADGMLIGNNFNNIKMLLNGYSGVIGKSASQVCAERFQMGGSAGYGDIARAEFQAKRINDPGLPVNRCVYSDVEYLQNNSFTCDSEEFTPIDATNPSVTVRRLKGKYRCLGVSFNDVCLQRTVEVTCKWTLRYLAPASMAGKNSTHPSENITKKFVMSEGEYNAKYNSNPSSWGNYLCNTLAVSENEPPSQELVKNPSFNKNGDFWKFYGNAYWQNAKVKAYSGPVLNDPADGVAGVKSIPGVGNPEQQGFNGYNATVYINFIPKSPVYSPTANHISTTFLYARSGFNCNLGRSECTYSLPPNGVYYENLLLGTVKLEDSNGYKSYYDIRFDGGFDYDQSTSYVGNYGKKLRCNGSTGANSVWPGRYTKADGNYFCGNGACYSNPLSAVRRYHSNAYSVLSWDQISGDWRRKCGGDYVYSVGFHFFLERYPRVRIIKRFDLEGFTPAKIEQAIVTEQGKKYRVTGFMKSALEEVRDTNGMVKVFNGTTSAGTLLNQVVVRETGLSYPLSKAKLSFIDFTFEAPSNNALIQLTQYEGDSSAYFDDISVRKVNVLAGPPVLATSPPTANVIGIDGTGYYYMPSSPTALRTSPGYDVEKLKNLDESSWKISYTPIGAECPAYSDKIKTNYLASAIAYDENNNACDDVGIPEDPQQVLAWQNVGYERKAEFGTEEIACSPSNCSVDFTIEDLDRKLNTINTSDGISGTSQGQGIVFVYDAKTITSQANVGVPGYAGPNDLPALNDKRMCAKVQDVLSRGEESVFASEPAVQFRRYKWQALEVTGADAQPRIPENNGKRVYIFKKLDSSVRHLLKQELL